MARYVSTILFLALICTSIGGRALASDSRDAALQSHGWMTADDIAIWELPTELLGYPNNVYGELSSEFGASDYAGGHLAIGKDVLRIFVGHFPGRGAGATLLRQVRAGTYRVGNVPPDDVENSGLVHGSVPDGRIHAVFGLPWGEKGRVAAGVDYSSTTWADALEPGPTEGAPSAGSSRFDQAELINLHGGVSLPLAPFDLVALGVHVGLPSFEGRRESTVLGTPPYIVKTSYRNDGGSSLGLTARGTLQELIGRETEAYLFLRYETGSLDGISKHNSALDQRLAVDSRKELGAKSFTAGFANNHHFSSRLVAIWSTEFNWTRSTIDVTDEAFTASDAASRTVSELTSISWPATIAVEGWLRSWWAARFSASSDLWGQSELKARLQDYRFLLRSVPENHNVVTDSREAVGIGTTLRFGGFSIDGVVNRSLLYDGPYFLGGSSTGIFTQISLGYEF